MKAETQDSTIGAVQVDLVTAKREYDGLMDKYIAVLDQRNALLADMRKIANHTCDATCADRGCESRGNAQAAIEEATQ